MKNFKSLGLLMLIAVIGFAFTNPVLETYKVDTTQSQIIWKWYKVTGEHSGTIDIKQGALEYSEGVLTGGNFTIDMNSISCTDLEGEWKTKLEGHLKSDDFFGVAAHPTAQFKITKVVPRGTDGSYKLIGNLTIKDITKEVKFTANIKEANGQRVANAKTTIDRSDFNVKYGSGSFFGNLGDKTIYDEFDLEINLTLK
jgi:Uncharacterized conserved protein